MSHRHEEFIVVPEMDQVLGMSPPAENLVNQPSPENMKADTPERERRNILDRVSGTL